MEAKFDPKAKVKQGQLSDGPEGKQPNREHTNIDFSQHTHRKQEPFAYDALRYGCMSRPTHPKYAERFRTSFTDDSYKMADNKFGY